MKRTHIHLRELKSDQFKPDPVPASFRSTVRQSVIPHLNLAGYKVNQKIEIAVQICQHLILSNWVGHVIADSRHKSKNGLRVNVWDSFIKAGLARCCIGSELSGKSSRYQATPKLLNLFKHIDHLDQIEDLTLTRNSNTDNPTERALVVLQTTAKRGPKKLHRLDDMADNVLRYCRQTEDQVESINTRNLRTHSWCIQSEDGKRLRPINPCLRQVHSKTYGNAARLYGLSIASGQGLTKQQRRLILIDNEPAAELDFSCMSIRMLYHIHQVNPPKGAYRCKRLFPAFARRTCKNKKKRKPVRAFIKQLTNICFNTSSKRAAVGAVQNLLLKEHPDVAIILASVENISVLELVDRLVGAHPEIKSRFFTNIGSTLMTIDGGIMLTILDELTSNDVPAFGIHDSVVCRSTDVDVVEAKMSEVYKRLMNGFDPVIRREF